MQSLKATSVILAAAALLVPPSAGLAQDSITGRGGGGGATVRVQPFHFGPGALATWARDAGAPAAHGTGGDPQQFGLLLQKLTATANFAASGAALFEGHMGAEVVNRLAFDISGFPGVPFGPANGYCGSGAPRFDVQSNAGPTCFLGCAHGQKTQDPDTGWWTIRFEPPFTQYPGCEGGISGTVSSIVLVFDEGTDVGPGSVVLDNLRVNNRVVGKPQGAN